jgi:hypothetical protein
MALGVVGILGAQGVRSPWSVVPERVGTLTRESAWRLVRTIPLGGGSTSTVNQSHHLDYQDCKYVGEHLMLCGGVTEARQAPNASPFRLGGLEIVNLQHARALAQVPVLL